MNNSNYSNQGQSNYSSYDNQSNYTNYNTPDQSSYDASNIEPDNPQMPNTPGATSSYQYSSYQGPSGNGITQEKHVWHINGFLGAILCLIMFFGGLSLCVGKMLALIGVPLVIIAVLIASSLTIIQPNNAEVLTFLGKYLGTIQDNGIFMTVPLTKKVTVSKRVLNFNSKIIKVNDAEGNPVDISAVVVYKVVDPAKAIFNVADYTQFVTTQSEAAIRYVSSKYPYDSFDGQQEETLRGDSNDVTNELTNVLQQSLNQVGIQVIQTRLTHLAYSAEIASAMLKRQQATAVLSAKKILVSGVVGIVEDVINKLETDANSQIPVQDKDKIINNLLVSLTNESGTQNVVNTGSDN